MLAFLKKPWPRRILIIVAAIVAVLLVSYRLLFPGVPFLLNFLKNETVLADAPLPGIEMRRTRITTSEGTLPLKILTPIGGPDQIAVVVHGVHKDGYNESRLYNFAVQLVRMGYGVVLPDIASLKKFALEPAAVNEIESTVRWTLRDSKLVQPGAQVSLFGISFAGGLCLSAGARESIRDSISSIFSFGGHGDLDETLTYLIDGRLQDGTHLLPHVYGQAVVARIFAPQLVPPDQVSILRDALLDYLDSRHAELRKRLDTLPRQTRDIVALCLNYKGEKLGHLLGEKVRNRDMSAVLSPVRGSVPSAAVFVLHGEGDNVIPRSQALRIGSWAGRDTDIEVLVSPLIQHVELGKNDGPTPWREYWRIIRFWTELLRA